MNLWERWAPFLRAAGDVAELLDFAGGEGAIEDSDLIEQCFEVVCPGVAATQVLHRHADGIRVASSLCGVDVKQGVGGGAYKREMDPSVRRSGVAEGVIRHSELGKTYAAWSANLLQFERGEIV